MSRRIAILGAGPIGLEAALLLASVGHSVQIFDRGDVADNILAWGFVRLFSPWKLNVTPQGLDALGEAGNKIRAGADDTPTGHEFREQYLLPISRIPPIAAGLRLHTTVLAVGREDFLKSEQIGSPQRGQSPFRILTRDRQGVESLHQADVVLDCTGVWGHHRWAGRGGIPAPGEIHAAGKIRYVIPDVLGSDRMHFAGRHTLLLGGGHSAATVLFDIAQLLPAHPATRLTWAIRRRGSALSPIENDPLVNRRNLVQAALNLADHPPPWLQFLSSGVLESIAASSPFSVVLSVGATRLSLRVDQVVALVGYMPDSSIFQQLQIHQCYATAGPMKLAAALLAEGSVDCLKAGSSLGPETMKNPEPDFYILGAKSYGTSGNFLLQAGHRQIRDVLKLIGG